MRIITKKGYALIEVIITLAILGAVAMPLAMFLQSVISKSLNDSVSDAAFIASNYMDKMIATADFDNLESTVIHGGRNYTLDKSCLFEDGIMNVYILIKKSGDEKPLFTLYRGVYVLEETE